VKVTQVKDAHPDPEKAWRDRAPDLAGWFWPYVNRVDVFGGYLPIDRRGPRTLPGGKVVNHLGPITRPAVQQRGMVVLSDALLVRHFRAAAPEDVLGLHSTSADNTSRWGAVDVDHHGATSSPPEANLAAALHWYGCLRTLGFLPLLTDSNGKGGYHLRALFSEPAPTPLVYAFLKWLIRDHAAHGLPNPPETFPKQARVPPGRYGNWLRLPGRHHTKDHWARAWDGRCWLDGADAVAFILGLRPSSPSRIPADLPTPGARAASGGTGAGNRAAADDSPRALVARIKSYLRKLPSGLGEGEHRDDVAFLFGAFLVHDLALSDAVALQWLNKWDEGNRARKGEDRLREILANVHAYGGGGGRGPNARRPAAHHGHDTITFSFTTGGGA
jgi:hypothetical protein